VTSSVREQQREEWNASATLAERIREQTSLSLTERLKLEFGVDTSETDDEDRARGKLQPQIIAVLKFQHVKTMPEVFRTKICLRM
jgi:hypothetical protein